MSWIKVEKKLPEVYQEVLVYGNYYIETPIIAYINSQGIWCCSLDLRYTRIGCDSTRDSTILNQEYITHWRTLPKTPKK